MSVRMSEQDALTLRRRLGYPRLDNLCGEPSDYRNRDGEVLCCSLDKGHEGRHRAGPLCWGEDRRWDTFEVTVRGPLR